MTNRLSQATSPYLLQHAHNPVHWELWDHAALKRAQDEDLPILLSIGYSACHWCHVMEAESFSDPAVAEVMNREFVCIKVDREERPDIDALYIDAVQAMTGSAGWPLHVFLTPNQVPFFGGTYFPPQPRPGLASWTETVLAVARAWKDRRADIEEQTEQIHAYLQTSRAFAPTDKDLTETFLTDAVETLRKRFDTVNGGFGKAPKFPQTPVLEFLLGQPSGQKMALQTLRSMASGGLFDQVGGGFARYSVDENWSIPHFEKMLYDNALLARTYLHAWQASNDTSFLRTCRATLDWMERELGSIEGGFTSSLDADSEGKEGTFYVWKIDEVRQLLGSDAETAIHWLGITAEGNFHGKNVLEARGEAPTEEVAQRIQAKLLAARNERERPQRDGKKITSWNALAICAFAEAGAALDEPRYTAIACKTANFILEHLRDRSNHLLRSWHQGQAAIPGYLDDYAHTVEAFLTLYEKTLEANWLQRANVIADQMIDLFYDQQAGGFFLTRADQKDLLVRRKELEDNPTPAGNSSAAMSLLRLERITGQECYAQYAKTALTIVTEIIERFPQGFGHALQALTSLLSPVQQIMLSGENIERFHASVNHAFLPNTVIFHRKDNPNTSKKLATTAQADQPTVYLCQDFTCQAPITEVKELDTVLAQSTFNQANA